MNGGLKLHTKINWWVAIINALFASASFTYGLTVYWHCLNAPAGVDVKADMFKSLIFDTIIPVVLICIILIVQHSETQKILTEFQKESQNGLAEFQGTTRAQLTAISDALRPLNDRLITVDQKLDRNFHFTQLMIEITELRALLLQQGNPVLRTHTEYLFKKLPGTLRKLLGGHFYEHDPEDFHGFVMNFFSHTKNEIIATSLVCSSFWLHPSGVNYLKENEKLISGENGKKIKITRYFLFKASDSKDEKKKFEQVIKEQIKAGVTVKVVTLDVEKNEYEKDAYRDIGIMDNEIAIFDTYDPQSGKMLKCDCYLAETPDGREGKKFAAAKGIIAMLESMAMTAEDFLKSLATSG